MSSGSERRAAFSLSLALYADEVTPRAWREEAPYSGLECSKNDIISCVTRILVKKFFKEWLWVAEVIRNPYQVHKKGQGCIWAWSMTPKLQKLYFSDYLSIFSFYKAKIFITKLYFIRGTKNLKKINVTCPS